jgi:glycine cleavage system T protein
MSHTPSDQPLKKTPLNAVEHELGGKMVDFGGWELPVQYSGILEEHEAVRTRVGIFDVSHMGEVTVRGRQALELLQKTTCNDVAKLEDGRAQYTGLLYPNAGFVDDILIYRNSPDDYFVVVNASNTDKDFEWLAGAAKGLDVEVRNVSADYAQLAVQGPDAERTLQALTDLNLSAIKYYRFAHGKVDGVLSCRAPAIPGRTASRCMSHRSTGRASCGSSSRKARNRAVSAPATRSASRRRWRSTEMTSTTRPPRSRPTWAGS